MATSTISTSKSAAITIPAEYLEDVRTALVAGIHNDSDGIRADQESVLDGHETAREDLAGTVRILREDVGLLAQVLDASSSVVLTGDRDAVVHVLESTVRVLVGRLSKEADYAPIGMGAVVELAGRLRWAADEAIRIMPEVA